MTRKKTLQTYHIYGIYNISLHVETNQTNKVMSTITAPTSKRKIIDLKEDTFKTLSIMAVQKGTNLKKYIEDLLNDIADNYEDAKLYAQLAKEHPEGLIPASKKEQEEFEKWLGV